MNSHLLPSSSLSALSTCGFCLKASWEKGKGQPRCELIVLLLSFLSSLGLGADLSWRLHHS